MPKEIKQGKWSNKSSFYLDWEMALRKPHAFGCI
jgi:hypothetical protein